MIGRSFLALGSAALLSASAHATQITVSMSDGPHSAEAVFEFADTGTGNPQLSITLTNTMTDNTGPNWLTGLFFDIEGRPELTYVDSSADMITMPGESSYIDHSIGQFWAFRGDIASSELPFGSGPYGLSAVGAGVFGNSDMLESGGPHPQPNGVKGGILADITGLSVPSGHEDTPFALGSVSFLFELPSDYDIHDADVFNVAFLFGSGFDEIVLIPLPAPALMGLAGLAAVVVLRRRWMRPLKIK